MDWVPVSASMRREPRKQAIYHAALELFTEQGYEDTSLDAIASRAGFSTENVFRHYHSKDEVFLDIFMAQFDLWLVDLAEVCAQLPVRATPKQFATVFVDSLVEHKYFLSLTPHLFISLEANSSGDQLFRFKCYIRDTFEGYHQMTERIYPEFTLEDTYYFLRLIHGPISSFWASSQYNSSLNAIYQHDDFASLRPVFARDLYVAVEIILTGCLALKAPSEP